MTDTALRLAVVIPTKDSARTLGRCLASLSEQSTPPDEVVVVDNASTDDTVTVATKAGATVLAGGPERSAQRNIGWRAARAELVMFIDSDMVLEPRVVGEAVEALSRRRAVGSLVVPERAFGEGFLARCRALEKEIYIGLGSVEAARVYRREALESVRGWSEDLTAYEDWDLADRVQAAGWATGRIAPYIWHDEGHINLVRCFRKKRYYGRWMPRYLEQGGRGVVSNGLERLSFRALRMLLASPVRSLGLALLKSVEIAGFLAGAADARRSPGP